MDKDAILEKFQGGEVFDKPSFRQSVHSLYPDCSEAMINWLLHSFREKGILSSVGAGKYYVTSAHEATKKMYIYPHSPEFFDLETQITDRFPLLKFQMWELIQMNDFVNHQIAKNVIFIETLACKTPIRNDRARHRPLLQVARSRHRYRCAKITIRSSGSTHKSFLHFGENRCRHSIQKTDRPIN